MEKEPRLRASLRSPFAVGLLTALLAAVPLGYIQSRIAGFAGTDDYYHVGWSRHIAEQGAQRFPPPFPWLPHTILNPEEYVDHHLLYHVLLSFFLGGDALLGGKLAAVVFAAAAVGAFAFLLARWGVPYPLLWAGVLVASSHPFLYRMSMVRAQSLSLAFLLVAVALADSARPRSLLYLGILYVWLYDAFPLLLVVVALNEVARFLVERRMSWSPLAHAAAGIGLGLMLHPYFPLNLLFTYRHVTEKIIPRAAVPVGREWLPYDSKFFLTSSALALALLAAGVLVALLRSRRVARRELTALLLAVVFLLMAAQSRRFIEYAPPFAVLGAALVIGDSLRRVLGGAGWRPRLAASGISLVLLAAGGYNLAQVSSTLAARPVFDRYAGAARWLADNSPPGAVVFTSDWDDFSELFFFNRHNRYLAGLDPTYSSLYRPAAYARWREITEGDLESIEEIRELWQAEYAFTDREHRAFYRGLETFRGAELVYQDSHSLVYRLGRKAEAAPP
jgi:hypothetical protein